MTFLAVLFAAAAVGACFALGMALGFLGLYSGRRQVEQPLGLK